MMNKCLVPQLLPFRASYQIDQLERRKTKVVHKINKKIVLFGIEKNFDKFLLILIYFCSEDSSEAYNLSIDQTNGYYNGPCIKCIFVLLQQKGKCTLLSILKHLKNPIHHSKRGFCSFLLTNTKYYFFKPQLVQQRNIHLLTYTTDMNVKLLIEKPTISYLIIISPSHHT